MLTPTLVGFGHALRDAGLPVGTGDVVTFCAAAGELDPADLLDMYWAGRSTLVTRREQLPAYHDTFLRYFLDEDLPPDERAPYTRRQRAEARATLAMPETEPGPARDEQGREALLGLVASDADTLKHKSFSACTPEEVVALRRIMRTIRLAPPRRRTRRTEPGRGRRPDLRRTVRETMRAHGEPARLYLRHRRLRQRPLTLLLDVSGSMADHSRALLQFAHVAYRSTARVEAFCFGTRLTRITRELRHRRTDDALDRAAHAVLDFDGGTRIGDSLETFVSDWGRRGIARGGIVVICSDGLDRGDPELLEHAMQRLSRQCHRIIWLTPHTGEPRALGLQVAAPYVDAVLPARDLADLTVFAGAVSGLG
ncbi:vWA domain-containing protein [Nocardioides cheoyonin]|uniref:vWA domain-containing protein n=1 Tax=Nocardioides cheoyonin TaxID=3156615 RepID=UPI0032B44440